VRIIAATNSDLEDLIEENKFRQDLFFRLNVIKIELPSLYERKEDIPLLVEHFLDIFSKENKKEITGVSEEVMEVFANYSWPGNIRELENLVERAVVLTKTNLITRNNLPPFLYKPEGKEEMASLISVNSGTLKEQTQLFQKNWILEALRKTNGVQKKAAQLLGVKPTTLNEMIKRLDIDINNLDI
jgi:transcriptional regulator with PAS, ATPase and Fis domain